ARRSCGSRAASARRSTRSPSSGGGSPTGVTAVTRPTGHRHHRGHRPAAPAATVGAAMLTVNDVPVSSAAGLSAALVADWDRSRLLLSDAAWSQLVSRWIDESGDASVLELADELGASSPDHRVARLASFLDPHRPPSYHDRPLDRRRLRD